jgi:hypothetical protein
MSSKFIILTEVYESGGFFKYSTPPGGDDTQRRIFSSTSHGSYSLRKVLVNVNHITVVKDYPEFVERAKDNCAWSSELREDQGFTRLQMNCGSNSVSSMTNMIVLGSYELTTAKILEAAS